MGNQDAVARRDVPGSHYPLRDEESTARIISPLVEVVGGPVASFVYTIRKVYARAEQSRHIYSYGMFSVSFGAGVTEPLWVKYRHLAPDEWKRAFANEAG